MECEALIQSPNKPTSGLEWKPVQPISSTGMDWNPTMSEHIPGLAGHSHMSIPPPPPPAAWPSHSSTEMDSDSLYSMLMSWYMAGYHTGARMMFILLKQNNKEVSSFKS